MKKIDTIIDILKSIDSKLSDSSANSYRFQQDNQTYLFISEIDSQGEMSEFMSSYSITKKVSGKTAVLLTKFIDSIVNRYRYEIDFLSFSVIDLSKFHNSRLFNVCNLLLKNPSISEWMKDNLIKNHRQNEPVKLSVELSDMDNKHIELLRNVFYNFKKSGIIKGIFSFTENQDKVKLNMEAYINNSFISTGWYELVYISKISNLSDAILLNNVRYKKGVSVAELDLMVIKGEEIYVFEFKNTKQIQSLYSGLEQLEYHQKAFSLSSSNCFLVINDDFPNDDKLKVFLEKIKEKGFRFLRVSELGSIF